MSTDVIVFINKAVRSGESDKILVKEKKGRWKEWATSTICIFRYDTLHTASACHALLFFLFLLYNVV